MKDLSHVDVDEILVALGSNGRYQILMYFLSTLTYFSEAFHGLSIVFLGKENDHHCAPPPNNHTNQTGDIYGKCTITQINNDTGSVNVTSCIYGYTYEHPKDMSIMSEYDLVCDREAFTDFSQTLLNLGMAIGSASIPLASDRFGRRPIIVVSHLGLLVAGVASSFAPNYGVFALTRFLNGALQQGTILAAVTYAIEIFPKEKRRYCGCFGLLMWSVCVSTLSPVAYLVRMYSWQMVNLAISTVSLYALIQYWTQDESIRWLVANNKLQDAVKLIKKAARINKVNVNKPLRLVYQRELLPIEASKPNDQLLALTLNTEDVEDIEVEWVTNTTKVKPVNDKSNYNFIDILKNKQMVVILLIIWFVWFTNSLTYYGIFLTSSTLAGNMYLNFFLNALVEAPSALIYWFTIDRIGRKKTAMMFHAFAAVGMIGATIFRLFDSPWSMTAATAFSLFGKFGISGSFNVIFIYTPEIFPTNVRNISFGLASTAARIGGMIAPFSSLLAKSVSWAPGAIFGAFCLIATGLITFLPETMGKELPQTMEDLKQLYSDNKKDRNEKKLLSE